MLSRLGRTVFFYLLLVAVMRLLGKRQLGQLEPSEVAVTMVTADLASMAMQDSTIAIHNSLVPIIAVVAMEYLLSRLAIGSIPLRKLFCGKPVILMENGNFIEENLRKTRVTLDELTGKLREKDVLDPSTVQYAILETGGNLSVILYPEEKPASAREAGICVEKQALPVAVVSDGLVLEDNLRKSGKNRRWLEKTLSTYQSSVEETLLLTVDSNNAVLFYPKSKKKHPG